jgi:lipoprotein-anchoring transpeptidase ErfK/SrfK
MQEQKQQTTGYRTSPQKPLPSKPRKKKLPSRLVIIGGFVAAGVLMMLCMVSLLAFFVMSQPTIAAGVTVAGVAIGGEQAKAAQQELAQAFTNRTVRVTAGETALDVPLSNLGISVNVDDTISRAQEAASGSDVTPVYAVDLVQAQSGFVALSDQVNVVPQVEPPQVGYSLEIPVMLSRLRENVAGELADGVLDLTMIEVQPPEPEPVTAQNYTGETTTHIVERGQELGLIARQYAVAIEDIVALNEITDPDLLYVGQELLIPAGGEYQPSEADAPAPSTTVGRALVVSITNQRIYAYENGELVRSHLTSTGLPETPTVLGDYSVYVKYVADDMSGPDYFLPQVPYTMYFYQGYAVHGTYWHNSFGRPMSHGCVNLPVDEAEWFFNFASVGTPVRVVS